MSAYSENIFTSRFLDYAHRERPLPDAAALAEVDGDLAQLPGRVDAAQSAAAAAVTAYEATRFGSPAMVDAAAALLAAVAADQPTQTPADQLEELHRSGPARLAAAVTACAVANRTRAQARATITAALDEHADELAGLRRALEQQIHDLAVTAEHEADTSGGFRAREQLRELDQQWGRVAGLIGWQRGQGYRAWRNCPAADPAWEPEQASIIGNRRASFMQRIGARQ